MIDKNEFYQEKIIEIANSLEALRLEIYRNNSDDLKQELDDKMFKLQSDIRNLNREVIEFMYFN